MADTARRSWDRSFFLVMALLAMVAIVLGFRTTIDENLIHPDWPRPLLLWHRRVGAWALVVGIAIRWPDEAVQLAGRQA